MKIRNVLSLFDGISCGQLALHRAGIEYDTYYASEIDKNPIYITQYNFPNTIQLGDVEKWKEWNIEWDKIDLLIGGSPCTNLSIAGDRKGLEGEESRLFYSYVDILNHIKKFNPNVKFLLENVESMSDENKGIINNYMGCKPVMINSALLSAQNRKRYYWVNWHLKKESLFGLPTCTIPQPKDKGIVLKDILESSVKEIKEPNLAHYLREFGSKGKILLDDEKASTLTAAMGEGGGNVPCVANEVSQKYYSGRIVGRPLDENGKRKDNANLELTQVVEISSDPNKANNLSTVQKDNVIVEKIDASCLRYERTEEGKKLRKQYESGEIKHGYNEHRILSPRTDGKTNTLTTVEKDNMICEPICVNSQSGRADGLAKQPSCADRIYDVNGKSVALASGWKQNIAEPMNNFVKKKYEEFATEKGYIPTQFNPYNKQEITDKVPSQTTRAGSTTTSSTVLMFEPYRLGTLEGRSTGQANRIYSVQGKSICLNANGGGGGAKTGLYKINLPDGDYIIRKLTPIECERLQTVPDNYTEYGLNGDEKVKISNGARYKALGNGWTVDVISYIFSFLV